VQYRYPKAGQKKYRKLQVVYTLLKKNVKEYLFVLIVNV